MNIEGFHEKQIFSERCPVRIILNRNVDFEYPLHWHNADELLYVVESPFKVFVNSSEYKLRERDIIFIPGGNIHGFHGETYTGTRVFVNFDPERLSRERFPRQLSERLQFVQVITPEQTPQLHEEIETQIQKAVFEFNSRTAGYQDLLKGKAINILELLSRNTNPEVLDGEEDSARSNFGIEKVRKAFNFIEDHYSQDIELIDVANASGFSKCYFSRLFKDVTEKNFHEYLSEFRVKKAEKLLMDGNNSIMVAAESSGFSNITTFERIFKRVNGCTPMEYRKAGRVGAGTYI